MIKINNIIIIILFLNNILKLLTYYLLIGTYSLVIKYVITIF